MLEDDVPTLWSLTCPRCGEMVAVEMPLDHEAAPGVGRCSAGHELLTFDSDTLGRLVGAAPR